MRLLTEFGMGTSLRRGDYTEAAARAIRNALWSHSINAAEVMGLSKEDMRLDVVVGVAHPDAVNRAALLDIFPYGQARIEVIQGGLDIPRPEGEGAPTIMASVAISVGFDVEPNLEVDTRSK